MATKRKDITKEAAFRRKQEHARKLGEEHARKKVAKQMTAQTYLQAVVDEIKVEDIASVTAAVVRKAKEGDKAALTWLGKYVLGNGKIDLREIGNPGIFK